MIKITPSDRNWLSTRFPDMAVISPREMRGEFAFRASLVDKSTRCVQPYYRIPDESVRQAQGFIEERFCVRVCFPESGVPEAWEMGERLRTRCEKLKGEGEVENMLDMHVYPGCENVCCGHPTYVRKVLQEKPEVGEFIEGFLIPYFYFHGYWEKYGEQPWEGLSHCIAVATLQQIAADEKNVRLYLPCVRHRIAGSGGQFLASVTPDAKRGMVILLQWLERNKEDDALLSELQKINLHFPAEEQ